MLGVDFFIDFLYRVKKFPCISKCLDFLLRIGGVFSNTFSETIQIIIQCIFKILCLYVFHGVFSSWFLCMTFVEFFESLSLRS